MVSGRVFIKVVTSVDAAVATAIFVFFSIHEVTAYSENTILKARWFEAPDLGSTAFVQLPIPGSSSAISPDSPEPPDEPGAADSTCKAAAAADDQPDAPAQAAITAGVKPAAEVVPGPAINSAAPKESNTTFVMSAGNAAQKSAPSADTDTTATAPPTTAASATSQPVMTSVVDEGNAVGAGAIPSMTVAGATGPAVEAAKANGKSGTMRRQLKRNRSAAAASASA